MGGGIPHLSFASADVPPAEGRQRWEVLVGAYDVKLPDGQCEADFSVDSEAWLLGQLVVTRGRLSPVRLIRARERIVTDGRETFTLGLVTQGLLAGDFDGRTCELRPGQVCVIDFARPWHAATAATAFVLLSVPRAALLALAPNAHDAHGRLLEGATARLLTEHLISLVRHLPQATAADAAIIERSTLHMVADSLGALAPGEDAGAVPLETRLTYRVRRYIEENLGEAELSPARICTALGVARPTLYRAFARSGGIMSYIQRRRLEAVHVRLSDAADARGVAELAMDAGFRSHAHFSTAFRKRFGYAPRDALLNGASAPGAAMQQFGAWFLELAARTGPP